MSSTTMSAFFTTDIVSLVSSDLSIHGKSTSFGSRQAMPEISRGRPMRCPSSSFCSTRMRAVCEPTVPAPSKPTRIGAFCSAMGILSCGAHCVFTGLLRSLYVEVYSRVRSRSVCGIEIRRSLRDLRKSGQKTPGSVPNYARGRPARRKGIYVKGDRSPGGIVPDYAGGRGLPFTRSRRARAGRRSSADASSHARHARLCRRRPE